MSVVVPGPNVVSQRRTSSAYPSSLDSGAGTSSSHRSIGFQRCREIRQWLSFSARTIAPDAPSWVSTRGAIGTSPPHLVPGETETVPATSGTRARISVVVRPRSSPCRASRTARRASSSQAAPSSASPAAAASLAILRNSWSATRAAALPHAAGSRSRGKTNRVRRIASWRTRVRSSNRAASTSATETPSTRQATDR